MALPVTPGGTFFDPPSVLFSGGDIYVYEDVQGASNSSEDGLDEYVSADGGTSFTLYKNAVAFFDNETDNPVIMLPNGTIGTGGEANDGNPAFEANPGWPANPNNYSTNGSPHATLDPSPNNYTDGSSGGQFASQLTGSALGILGVFIDQGAAGLNPDRPCWNDGEGLVFSYATVSASTTDAVINENPSTSGSPWSPLAKVDCETENPAVGGGPSGLGLLETYDPSLGDDTVQYRTFTPPATFGAPVTIAPGTSNEDSLSQDGSGGIYATWHDVTQALLSPTVRPPVLAGTRNRSSTRRPVPGRWRAPSTRPARDGPCTRRPAALSTRCRSSRPTRSRRRCRW